MYFSSGTICFLIYSCKLGDWSWSFAYDHLFGIGTWKMIEILRKILLNFYSAQAGGASSLSTNRSHPPAPPPPCPQGAPICLTLIAPIGERERQIQDMSYLLCTHSSFLPNFPLSHSQALGSELQMSVA